MDFPATKERFELDDLLPATKDLNVISMNKHVLEFQ